MPWRSNQTKLKVKSWRAKPKCPKSSPVLFRSRYFPIYLEFLISKRFLLRIWSKSSSPPLLQPTRRPQFNHPRNEEAEEWPATAGEGGGGKKPDPNSNRNDGAHFWGPNPKSICFVPLDHLPSFLPSFDRSRVPLLAATPHLWPP